MFLDMILWYQMMLMGHTNHMAQSVCHSDPCSAVYICFSELMQLFRNLNFSRSDIQMAVVFSLLKLEL
jgi:hypothetical protein